MTTPSILVSPARLIAEIPGILGFHPCESVTFILFKPVSHGVYKIGPVLRMDMSDQESLPGILAYINSCSPCVVYGVIAAKSPNETLVAEIIQAEIEGLDAVWHVNEVSEDEPYTAIWTYRATSSYDPDFLAGKVAPVHESDSARESLAKGDLIAINRDEAFKALTFNPELECEGVQLVKAAEKMLVGTQQFPDLILALREALVNGDTRTSQICITASMAVGGNVRDLALGELLEHPGTASDVLTDLAQRLAEPDFRAGALSMLACVLVAGGHTARAAQAIKVAHNTSEKHRLTQLLVEAACTGHLEKLVPAIEQAIRTARKDTGVPSPSS